VSISLSLCKPTYGRPRKARSIRALLDSAPEQGSYKSCDELLFKRHMTSDYNKRGCRTIAHRPGERSILPSCSNTFRALRIVVRLMYSSLANSLSVGSWLPGLRARSMISFSMPRLTCSWSLFGPLDETINEKQLRCERYYNPFLPIRQSPGRVVIGAIQTSQRAQIERVKFGRLRNKHRMLRVPVTCSDHCQY
jgi:hypothetical protein